MRVPVKSLGCIMLAMMHRTALACVTCDSQTACQVRHGIFGDQFVHTLLLTVAPFPIFVGAVAVVYFGFPIPRGEQV